MFDSNCWILKWEKNLLEVKKSIVWQKKRNLESWLKNIKKEYDKDVKALQGKTHYDYKRKNNFK